MNDAKGKLIGVSVGPGDPELMTLKAKRAIESSSVIAYPVKKEGETSFALEIVRSAADISGKEILELVFPMDPDYVVREAGRRHAIDKLCSVLADGQDVCMITLGDAGVFSTYMRIDLSVSERGYETCQIPGVTSFCAGAAKAKVPLISGEEGLAIIDSAKNDGALRKAFDDFDNIVVMKAYDSIPEILYMMREREIPFDRGVVISNIGMDDEYVGGMDPGREYGYFTTVIINKKRRWTA
ncbi:MAG: precorrin-2 C(20)-methyltransferase [Thermoplasmatales archaeon]|nr:precorrin-2 C(20)-methyltransferase [Thermoplasmatales archaeon]